jgi:hypothetical protein
MNNTKGIAVAYFAIVVILIIGLVSLGVSNDKALKDLNKNKLALTSTKNSLNTEIEKSTELNEQLNRANTIIESLKGEEYIVDMTVTNAEIEMLAKTVYGEAGGCNKLEQSAVVWCILNRVDAGLGTIAEVITAPNQFHGYMSHFPVTDDIRSLVEDVIARWKLEKVCDGNVGRTLPSEYLYFYGDGLHNHFRDAYSGDYNTWDWSYYNPYS